MFYFHYDLPCTDTGYMTEKAVKQVMNEVRPDSPVRFKQMPVDEIDEYIAAWQAGTGREYIEEMLLDAMNRDQFLKDTASLIWSDPAEYAEEIKRHIRGWFLENYANQLEQNIEAVLDHENCNEDAA